MKVLYLEHPEPDFGTSQLYMGLCQILGDENIIDFPYKYCSHGQVELLQNIDIKEFMRDNPTVFPNGGYSNPFPWTMSSNSPEYHYNEIKEMLRNGVFHLILMTTRSVSLYYLKRLIHDCNNNIPPVILCDFEDYHDIRFDISSMLSCIRMITKASYLPNNLGVHQCARKGTEKIFPLPLSSPLVDNSKFRFDDSNENKTIGIYARFGLTRTLRKDVIESLRNIKGFQGGISIPMTGCGPIIQDKDYICGDGGKFLIAELDNHVPYYQYLQEIAKSKISVSMGGHGPGRNPYRNWEIPSYNTMLLCEQQTIYYEHPFEDGKTCVFFNPDIRDDIYHKALYWLNESNENERRKISKAGNEHLKKYHTCRARAKRLLEIIKAECLA